MDKTVIINGREYTKEDVEKAKETIKNIWDSLVEEISKVVNEVVEVVKKIIDNIVERKHKKEHDYNWHVPLDMTVPPQIKIPKVNVPRIRSSI